MKKRITALLLMTVMVISLCLPLIACEAEAQTAFRYGLTTDEIKTIQTKLKRWGYYYGEVDGIYGSATVEAVKYFQRTNGLAVDGIVGSKTAVKLGMTLSGSTNSGKYSSSEINLLARVVYGEARGESYTGQVAVAAVVLNRVENSQFPNTIHGVVYEPGAFSVVDDGQINLTPDEQALKAARDAINGWDPTGGAIFYYNPKKTRNKFLHSRPVLTTIGNHRFCS